MFVFVPLTDTHTWKGGVLMSPIEISSAPLYTKEIQQKYYAEIPQLKIRRGPAVDDITRMNETVPYLRFHM